MRGMSCAVVLLAALLIAAPVHARVNDAADVASAAARIDSSMVVRGRMTIDDDGRVSSLQLYKEETLSPAIVQYIREVAARWRFAPRREHQARNVVPLNLRLVARPLDDGGLQLGIRGVSFHRLMQDAPGDIVALNLTPPQYPTAVFRAGAGGSVYLLLRVGRDGRVQAAFAEQVNLNVSGSEARQRNFREALKASALAATRRWRFRVPSMGDAAGRPYWEVRVPVEYSLGRSQAQDAGYGKWHVYVAGPREHAPWAADGAEPGFSPDALDAGGVYSADDDAPRLLTPVRR